MEIYWRHTVLSYFPLVLVFFRKRVPLPFERGFPLTAIPMLSGRLSLTLFHRNLRLLCHFWHFTHLDNPAPNLITVGPGSPILGFKLIWIRILPDTLTLTHQEHLKATPEPHRARLFSFVQKELSFTYWPLEPLSSFERFASQRILHRILSHLMSTAYGLKEVLIRY